MDCRDFLHLAKGLREGRLSPYARALFEWHRATCPRCAAAVRAQALRAARPARRASPVGAPPL